MKRLMFVLMFAALIAVPVSAQDQETLVIGVITAPDSIGGAAGESTRHGAELAAREINDAGGIEAEDGTIYRVRVMLEEAANSREAADAITRLSVIGADVIIGFNQNSLIPSTLPENSAPILVMSSGADGTLWGASPLIFGARANDATLAEAAARFAIEEREASTLAVVVARAEYGYAAEDGVMAALDADAELVLSLDHDAQSLDFADIAAQIADQDPDALIVWNAPAAFDALLSALAAENWRGDVIYGSALNNVTPPDGIEVYGVVTWTDTDDSDDFIELYADNYSDAPSAESVIAYDAVNLIAAAVEQSGADRADLIDWLNEDADYSGVQGDYLPRTGQGELIRAVYVVEIDGGAMIEAAQYQLDDDGSDSGTDDGDSGTGGDVTVQNGTSGLNLRAAPNSEAAVLLVIPAEAEFTAFARNDDTPDQDWIAVTYDGQDGWVIGDALYVIDGSLEELDQSARTFALN